MKHACPALRVPCVTRALRRAGFNPPWPTEVGPTTRHSCRLWALFHVNKGVLSPLIGV